MLNAADRMKSLGQQAADAGAPSSIFGSAGGLAQSIQTDDQFRISIYPIVSADLPEAAMGLASCLAYLVEQYSDTRVYRCFAKIEPEDESGEIAIEDFQFSVDDWEMEGLADNVRIYGSLDRKRELLALQLAIDTSLLVSDDPFVLEYQFSDMTAVINALPAMAESILSGIGGETSAEAIISYAPVEAGGEGVAQLLEKVFDWNLDIYLTLWDVQWAEEDVRSQYLDCAAHCQAHGGEFAYWCLGMMAKQALQAGLEDIGESVAPMLEESFQNRPDAAPGAAAAALGLSQMGYHARSATLLRPHVASEAPTSVWISMIQIYWAAGQLDAAIDANQLALEKGLDEPAIIWQYVSLLMAAEANSWEIQDVLLIEPDEFDQEAHLALEIANALKLYVDQEPDDLAKRQLALSYMIDAGDEEIWHAFEQLIQRDREGDFAGEIVERLIDLDNHSPAYEILERYVDANPYAYVMLAQLSLLDDDSSRAIEAIAACRGRYAKIDDELELELQRLDLSAELPGFEATFAEIKLVLSASRHVSNEHFETLEAAIGIAPDMVDLYLILSRCYLSQNDDDNALEVLREGEQYAGVHPQIQLGLARIMWARSQKSEAIELLNAGLSEFPTDVYLLAQMANYLIVNDQFDDAREFIARAETIAPSHRAIGQLRRLVAQRVALLG